MRRSTAPERNGALRIRGALSIRPLAAIRGQYVRAEGAPSRPALLRGPRNLRCIGANSYACAARPGPARRRPAAVRCAGGARAGRARRRPTGGQLRGHRCCAPARTVAPKTASQPLNVADFLEKSNWVVGVLVSAGRHYAGTRGRRGASRPPDARGRTRSTPPSAVPWGGLGVERRSASHTDPTARSLIRDANR